MSPKKKSKANKSENTDSEEASGPFESLGKKLDSLPEVQQAEAAVQAARKELQRAQRACAEIRQQAGESLDQIREKNVGDLISETLHQVSKRPALGVGVSLFLGIFIGRIMRR